MHLFLIFIANNAKTIYFNSLFWQKLQTLNNQPFNLPTVPKTAWSHLEGRAKGERRVSEG